MDRTDNPRRTILVCVCLGAITLAAFWPVLHNGFVNYDDPDYVTENSHVLAGLSWASAGWAFRTDHAANWHPLTWLSHILDVEWFGLNPAGHHLTSLLLHAVNVVLLFLLLKGLTAALWRSAFVAALFALHPLHVESVAWVAERKDVLSGFFFMLTLLAYVKYVSYVTNAEFDVRGSKCRLWYGLALVFFALGLMSKPMLVTLPFVLLLLDFWPLGRLSFPTLHLSTTPPLRLILEKLPFFLLSALSSAVTYLVQHAGGATVPITELSLPGRIGNVLVSYVRYLGKLVWPADLAVPYPRPMQWPAWEVAGAALLLALIAVLAVRLLPGKRYVVVGWFWFVGTLVPVIGLVQVGEQAMADRYTYLPSIGLFVLISWGAEELARRSKLLNLLTGSACLCAIAALLAATRAQMLYWQDSETLFRHAAAVTEDNPTAQENFASALSEAGKLDEAEQHCLVALRLDPNFTIAEITYATIAARRGRLAEAHARLAEVLRKNPRDASAHFSLAQAFNLSGDTARAIDQYREGLHLKPDTPDGLNNLAWTRATHSNPAFRKGHEAVQLAQRACELTGYQRPIMIGTLAAAYAEAGQFDEAIATAQKARALALASGQKDLAAKNQKLLELYQAHQPYHEPADR